MRCFSRQLLALGASFFLVPWGTPAIAAEETPAAQELRELKQMVLQQSKQIEMLTEQVGRLTRAVEGRRAPDNIAPGAGTEPQPAAESLPEIPKAEVVPKAEAVSGGTKHVVTKGETLTSIAKQYNIPIADLKNANKITDERKLQIGHILSVPTAKTPETSDKKENP